MICSDELGSEIRQWVWTRSEVQIVWQLLIWNWSSTLVFTFIFNQGSLDQCITEFNCPNKLLDLKVRIWRLPCILHFFYQTQVQSLPCLVSQSLLVVRLDWCDPGLWLMQPFKVMQSLLALSNRISVWSWILFSRIYMELCCWCRNMMSKQNITKVLSMSEQNGSSFVVVKAKQRPCC